MSVNFAPRFRALAHVLLAVSALAAAALAVPTRAFAQAPTFNTLISTYKGDPNFAHPVAAAVGDFNGDGKLDSAVIDGTSTIHVLLGNGAGSFAEHRVDIPLITASNAVGLFPSFGSALPHPIDGVIRAIKAVDVNGDGKLDIVCLFVVHLNFAPLWGTTVLINAGNDVNGVPQFTPATHYFSPFADLRSLTIGDLNSDGKPDFIVGSANGALLVYLNNGAGTFTAGLTSAMSLQPGAGGPAVGPGVIADLNGDGKADFLVSSNQNHATNIFFGNGDGTFQATPAIIPSAGMWPVVADVNNDGKPDFLEVDFGSLDPSSGKLMVYLNNGNGTFSGPTLYSTGLSNPDTLAIADMNGDGHLDMVTSDFSSNSGANGVAVLLGNGDGTFGTPNLYNVNAKPFDLSVGDFNGDGKLDIATVGFNDDTFGVLTNTTPFPAPAQMFFTDPLTGPTSPNITIPSAKYGYVASGLQRIQNSTGGGDASTNTDRPMVTTRINSYLTQTQFTATVTVNLTSPDIAYFGFGQGTPDSTYFQEPTNGFLFRIHSNWTGYSGIQVWPTQHVAAFNDPGHFFGFVDGGTLANYGGGPLTFMIQRNGDSLTMSIPSMQVSHTFSISQYASQMGLTATNTYIFFGNTNTGSVFSDLNIYQTPPDTTPPVITVPGNITTEATGPAGAVVTFTATATDNVDPTVTVTADVPSGSTFPLGTTTVHLSASDAAHNTATASFTVTVRDTTPPSLNIPLSITFEATGPSGAVVSWVASATDLVDGSVAVTCAPLSGATFALGTTQVSCFAIDAHGNKASGNFPVTVSDTTPPVVTASLVAVRGGGDDESTQQFRVVFSATDAVGVTKQSATLNGITVTNGQIVQLKQIKSGAQKVKRDDGRLQIQATSFTLTVTASDAAGNIGSATAVPVFVKHGKDDDDRKDKDDHSRDRDDRKGKSKDSDR